MRHPKVTLSSTETGLKTQKVVGSDRSLKKVYIRNSHRFKVIGDLSPAKTLLPSRRDYVSSVHALGPGTNRKSQHLLSTYCVPGTEPKALCGLAD